MNPIILRLLNPMIILFKTLSYGLYIYSFSLREESGGNGMRVAGAYNDIVLESLNPMIL